MKRLAIVMLVLGASACSRSHHRDREPTKPITQTAEPSDAIGERLMVALSQAKNLHHKAKIYTSDGDIDAAIGAVRQILSLSFPPNAPEAEDVRNDARALLARLLVGQSKLDEAMAVVTEGIAQSPRESFFVANLYTVKGEILEAKATLLEDSPLNKPRIVELRHGAIDAFDASNKIDEKLQAQLAGAR